jgi:hypothetical protein
MLEEEEDEVVIENLVKGKKERIKRGEGGKGGTREEREEQGRSEGKGPRRTKGGPSEDQN